MEVAEIQIQVAKYLRLPDLFSCTLVSRNFYSVFNRELYRNLTFTHSSSKTSPNRWYHPQLASSIYLHRAHIRSLRLHLLASQLDRLLCEIEGCAPKDADKKGKKPQRTTSKTILFPDLESISLTVFDDRSPQLNWLVHCPRLQSLNLLNAPDSWRKEDVDPLISPITSMFDILALPFWTTTLTHLRISHGALSSVLESQILHQCSVLTDLTVLPVDTTTPVLQDFKASLRNLDVSEKKAHAWVIQPVLGTFTKLETVIISEFPVLNLMSVPWYREAEIKDGGVKWSCLGLKRLHIKILEWNSQADKNRHLMVQLAELTELEFLEIETMRCDRGGTIVAHNYSWKEDPCKWNDDPCDEPLPWMNAMWPKFKGYKSGGWESRQGKKSLQQARHDLFFNCTLQSALEVVLDNYLGSAARTP
ncbi:hypothetical protein EMPS_06527 [Entomortierella parvispora]|uniref:F-box domain-containing protein n=1 Tax=Entomortierella parvispora TaxID=205924 RepID=A0A9P3LXI4_9FUNG|nr:hypothetical protein EMPS_06527 [Entomortierella parvispora]